MTELLFELLVGFVEITPSHWSVSIVIPKGPMANFVLSYLARLKISSHGFMITIFDIFFGHGFGLNFVAQQVLSNQ